MPSEEMETPVASPDSKSSKECWRHTEGWAAPSAEVRALSFSEIWWRNPVQTITGEGVFTLDEGNTVYVVTQDMPARFNIEVGNIALVIKPGKTITPFAGQDRLVDASGDGILCRGKH